jgi:hypothetical protein
MRYGLPRVFTKNRDRLPEAEVAKDFLTLVVEQAAGRDEPQASTSRRRKFAESLGQPEEFSAQEQEELASAV